MAPHSSSGSSYPKIGSQVAIGTATSNLEVKDDLLGSTGSHTSSGGSTALGLKLQGLNLL